MVQTRARNLAIGVAVGVALMAVVVIRTARRGSPEGELHITGPRPEERISDREGYRLRIWGKVDREVSLSLDEIRALPSEETDHPISCVLGWTDKGRWRGVPIRDVIALASPQADATHLLIKDDRTFSASLSMEYVQTGKPLLAYEFSGEQLPRMHGWPLRVVAPGKWGYKWVKWVTQIELNDRGYEGTYESSGYSLNGNLDEPKTESEKRGE
jgi:DMSO/TMAO reductase YedYZ molybdopterin-dependent catalytic subunit